MSRHHGVVVGLIDDLFPEDWPDFLDIPPWPDLKPGVEMGLSPGRWRQLKAYARTLQEQTVVEALAAGGSARSIAEQTGKTASRVRQIAGDVFARAIAEGREPPPQSDMFRGGAL